jgi:hypothetical protein
MDDHRAVSEIQNHTIQAIQRSFKRQVVSTATKSVNCTVHPAGHRLQENMQISQVVSKVTAAEST